MVKVGIIGAGFMGGMHSQCYKVLENAKLVAIADSQLNKAQELANKYGIPLFFEMGIFFVIIIGTIILATLISQVNEVYHAGDTDNLHELID